MGEWHIDFDWSDSFVESMTERFNQLLQAESIGAVSTAEFRAWVMNEDLDVAQAELEEIEKQQAAKKKKCKSEVNLIRMWLNNDT